MRSSYTVYRAKYNLDTYNGKSKKPKRKFTKLTLLYKLIKNTSGMLKNKVYNKLRRIRYLG